MNRKDKFAKDPLSLPTNIENATREHIRDSLPSWDAKIRARRARRLRISPEQAANIDAKPLFMLEIEDRAVTENRTVDSLLKEYRNRLRQSTYPTPACLLPDEVVAYSEGVLPMERLQHADTCNACATLLAGAVPGDEAAGEFVDTLRTPAPIGVEVEQQRMPAAAARWPGFDWGFAERSAGAVVIPAVTLIAIYVLSLRLDSNATRQTFLHNPLPWISGLILVWWSVTELKRHPVLRSVGIGLAFTAVLASSFLADFRHSQSSDRDLAIKSPLDQLTQISVNSLQNRQANGKFIDVQHLSGPLQIQTAEISRSQVRYISQPANKCLGQAVAEIGDNGGSEVKWEEGDKTIRQLQFLMGKLHNEGGVVTIQLSDGRSYNLKGTDLGNLAANTPVFALVDPSTASVHSLQILNRAPQEAMVPVPVDKSSD
jgi:hypothetical protein